MKYKVYNTTTKSFVDNDKDFILKPDGTLATNEYGDEIGQPSCIAIFFPTKNDDTFFDNVGGFHDGGTGVNPNGNYCGECTIISCEICPVWRKNQNESENNEV